jgi:hypothetical protein
MRPHRRGGPHGSQQGSELDALRVGPRRGLRDALRLSAVALCKSAIGYGTRSELRQTPIVIWPIRRMAAFPWTAGAILRGARHFRTRRSEVRTPERHGDEHHGKEQTRCELRRPHVVIVPQDALLRDVRTSRKSSQESMDTVARTRLLLR